MWCVRVSCQYLRDTVTPHAQMHQDSTSHALALRRRVHANMPQVSSTHMHSDSVIPGDVPPEIRSTAASVHVRKCVLPGNRLREVPTPPCVSQSQERLTKRRIP